MGPKLPPSSEVFKAKLFSKLMKECLDPDCHQLSSPLRRHLQKLSKSERKKLVHRYEANCTPVFHACRLNKFEIVRYLIQNCKADVETTPIVEPDDLHKGIKITMLCQAAKAGNLKIAKLLLESGANINATTDAGETPLAIACSKNKFNMAKYLIDRGADFNIPDNNGVTCLIKSMSALSILYMLLKKRANVNAQCANGWTILHHAVKRRNFPLLDLLVSKGGDVSIKTNEGDDVIQLACIYGDKDSFEFLTKDPHDISMERLANLHELIGTRFAEDEDWVMVFTHWQLGLEIREFNEIPKPKTIPDPVYANIIEFRTSDELNALFQNNIDADLIGMHSLIITERILGKRHKVLIDRLMTQGMLYFNESNHQRCIDSWKKMVECSIERDTVLHYDTVKRTQILLRGMRPHALLSNSEGFIKKRFEDCASIFNMLTSNLTETNPLLLIQPYCYNQVQHFEEAMHCLTQAYSLLLLSTKTSEQIKIVENLTDQLLENNLISKYSGDSVLHMVVASVSHEEHQVQNYEDLDKYKAIYMLLKCGANANIRNKDKSTPLHLALKHADEISSSWLPRLLIEYGAHVDIPDDRNVRPINILKHHPHLANVEKLLPLSLKCLASNVITRSRVPYKRILPKELVSYVNMHSPRD